MATVLVVSVLASVCGVLAVRDALAQRNAQRLDRVHRVASPAGVSIVWTEPRGVFEAAGDGSSARLVTRFSGRLRGDVDGWGGPWASPDGSTLVYTVGASDSTFMNLVRPGSGVQRQFAGDGWWAANWSPNGARLVVARGWCRKTGCWGGSSIQVVSLTGRLVWQVTRRQFNRFDVTPDWSPNGETICFTRGDRNTDSSELLLIGAHGGPHRRGSTGKRRADTGRAHDGGTCDVARGDRPTDDHASCLT
jgi:hypothetical protein